MQDSPSAKRNELGFDEYRRAIVWHCPHRATLGNQANLLRSVVAQADSYYGTSAQCGHLVFGNASFLQLSFYRPGVASREVLQDEHEDGNLITLCSSSGPGLEIKKGQEFFPITPSSPQLILMPGDIFSILSGGAVPALRHRVCRVPELEQRLSILFFACPDPNQPIQPWRVTDKNAGVNISERIITNPVQFGFSPLS